MGGKMNMISGWIVSPQTCILWDGVSSLDTSSSLQHRSVSPALSIMEIIFMGAHFPTLFQLGPQQK